MKKVLLGLVLIFSVCAFSQETDSTFILSEKKRPKFIVVDLKNKTQQEIYKKAIEWISYTYKNPKEVLLAEIENEYIRFEGFSDKAMCVEAHGILKGISCNDIKYQIEIRFKDNKYKFEIVSILQYNKDNKYLPKGYFLLDLNNSYIFKKNGEMRSMFYGYNGVVKHLNAINNSFKNFVLGNSNLDKKEW